MYTCPTSTSPFKLPLADRRWLWLIMCLVALLLSPTCVLANDDAAPQLILQQAFWEDPDGQASLAQAQKQTYTPYRGLFSRGFTSSAHWIRLTLAASTTRTVLLIKPTWLDSVTLHDPERSPSQLTLGDRHTHAVNAWPGLAWVTPSSCLPAHGNAMCGSV